MKHVVLLFTTLLFGGVWSLCFPEDCSNSIPSSSKVQFIQLFFFSDINSFLVLPSLLPIPLLALGAFCVAYWNNYNRFECNARISSTVGSIYIKSRYFNAPKFFIRSVSFDIVLYSLQKGRYISFLTSFNVSPFSPLLITNRYATRPTSSNNSQYLRAAELLASKAVNCVIANIEDEYLSETLDFLTIQHVWYSNFMVIF